MTNRIAPVWAFFTLVAFATGTVWVRLNIIHTTYAINEINQKIEKTHQAGKVLKLKLAALKSPKILEALARKKFHFSQPQIEQVVHFTRGLKGETIGNGV